MTIADPSYHNNPNHVSILQMFFALISSMPMILALSVGTTLGGEPHGKPKPIVLEGVEAQVNCLAYSPDGKLLATGDWGGIVALSDVSTHRRRTTHEVARPEGMVTSIDSLAFSPDGKTLAFATSVYRDEGVILFKTDEYVIELWDVAAGRVRATWNGHKEVVTSLAFSPDGKLLVSGSRDETVRLWDAASGRWRADLKLPKPERHVMSVESMVFSPDGATLALIRADYLKKDDDLDKLGSEILFYDLAHRRVRSRLGEEAGRTYCLAFSPDGTLLASGIFDESMERDDLVRLWDVTRGERRMVLRGHHLSVDAVAFRPGGKILATGGGDGMVRLWDVASGQARATIGPLRARIEDLAFSPDGRQLAVAWALPLLAFKDNEPLSEVLLYETDDVLDIDNKQRPDSGR